MIELQHVSAGYGSKLVVEDISLALRPGQVLTLLGPNGSGKSTLLRTIAGLHPMAGGQITVDGVPVKELTRRLAEVETSIYRLADAIKKTQKRANALQNIVIPGLDGTIRFITDALEEKEREEFARLKVIKRVTTKQK